jgi:hypothetical protein
MGCVQQQEGKPQPAAPTAACWEEKHASQATTQQSACVAKKHFAVAAALTQHI